MWEEPNTGLYTHEQVINSIRNKSFRSIVSDILSRDKISPRQQQVIDTAIRNSEKYGKLNNTWYYTGTRKSVKQKRRKKRMVVEEDDWEA